MGDRFVPRCQYCGKTGTPKFSTKVGVAPLSSPTIPGKCPCHPSGKQNLPHSPRWERA